MRRSPNENLSTVRGDTTSSNKRSDDKSKSSGSSGGFTESIFDCTAIESPKYVFDALKEDRGSVHGWFSLGILKTSFLNRLWQADPVYPGRHWKPITLQAPVLGGFIIVSLALIVLLEVLSHHSSGDANGGGIAFASSEEKISPTTTFMLLYLPTIVAICYSMVWSWVDLDTKRLEPWFQLSNPGGATAQNSLLLQYPFDFLPFIPITALKRKHWSVFCAGTIMLLIFWVITPLQSAIFNTGTATRYLNTTMGTSSDLLSFELQTAGLNANFLNTAYGISWLNQSLPPFTTREAVSFPFHPVSQKRSIIDTETWITTADVYSASLRCTPANVTSRPLGYTFSNDRGCVVSDVILADTVGIGNYMMNYVGYYDDPHSDWALQNPNCSVEFSNSYLALWASNSSRISPGMYSNLTALFCETSYHVQQSNIHVHASNGSVLATGPLDNSVGSGQLSDVFNISNFEYLLGVGVQQIQLRSSYPDTAVLEQYPQVSSYSLAWPISSMVGFAVALNPLPFEDLASPEGLGQAFEKAHQLLFATAFSTLTQNLTSMHVIRSGTRKIVVRAIIMVRPISITVEIGLGLIILLIASLWYTSHSRISNLAIDPASIADTLAVIKTGSPFVDDLRDDGTMTETSLHKEIGARKFYLSLDPLSRTSSLQSIHEESSMHLIQGSDKSDGKIFKPVRPKELHLSVGATLAGALIGALAAVIFLDLWSIRRHGLSLPSSSVIVLTIIENYLPTTFATLLEPGWVILNRILCLLQPFDELRKGNARLASSVGVKYTSLPPQLVIWRAVKAGHYLLACVCLVAISTNILAVSLSGLIVEGVRELSLPTIATQNLRTQFNGTAIRSDGLDGPPITFFDHFYVEMANLTEGTLLPPWIDKRHFYIPFNSEPPIKISSTGAPLPLRGIRGTTAGFGARSTCFELSLNEPGSNSIAFLPDLTGSQLKFVTSHELTNGTKITCVGIGISNAFNEEIVATNNYTIGLSALEAVSTMAALNNTDDEVYCSSLIVAGWVRADISLGTEGFDVSNAASTFIGCNAKVVAAEFEVLVDLDGHVLESVQKTNYSSDSAQHFLGNATGSRIIQQANTLMTPPAPIYGWQWHNDSLTSDWLNSLLGFALGSDAFVDPSLSPPSRELAIDLVQTIYQNLFAILLGLNTHVFAPATENSELSTAAIMIEPRLFISQPMFIITVVLLVLQLTVAILYYANRPKRFLPRMPTSIASVIAFVSASRALEDFGPNRSKDDNRNEHTYAYGRFVGIDGKTRVGIERQRYVIPLESQNPDAKRRKWGWDRKVDDETIPKTWI